MQEGLSNNKKKEAVKKPADEKEEVGFLSLDQLRDIAQAHFGNETSVTPVFKSYNGEIYAVECANPSNEKFYIYVSLTRDGISYISSHNNQEVKKSDYPDTADYEMLMAESGHSKVVKSRPPFMYPDLLGLKYSELWPRNAKVAVIGDPYMACDKEGVTIVEYEYGEEIVPPVIQNLLKKTPADQIHESVLNWANDVHREDIEALARIGHPLERPDYGVGGELYGNPYWHTVHDCFEIVADIAHRIDLIQNNQTSKRATETEIARIQKYLKVLHKQVQSLVNGTWERRDFNDDMSEIDEQARPWAKKNLAYYFYNKQSKMDKLGKPEEWSEYLERWEKYLKKLPIEEMRATFPDIQKHIEQIKYWLNELPNIKSSQRVSFAFSKLENAYQNFLDWAFSQPQEDGYGLNYPNHYVDSILEPEISDARGTGMMSDGAFGLDIPGRPVSGRTAKFLRLALHRAENAVTYFDKIWPKISVEMERMENVGVPFSAETKQTYLRSFELPLVQSFIPITQPEKAIAIHGFFPEKVKIDPQDRIIALTSVTMHGWNYLKEEEFKNNLLASLPFLKVGGQYILGPINQSIYFGQPTSNFDSEGLTNALKEMETEGLISYRFIKGRRQHDNEWSDRVEGDPTQDWSKDEKELLPNESAASLVIERLK